MSATVREQLFEYALGTLSEEEAATVESALFAEPALLAELRDIEQDVAAMVAGLAAPIADAGRKRQLLAAIAHHGRLERYAEQMAEMIDASVERARHLLRLVDDDEVWVPLLAGCEGLHIRPGPRVATQDVGLIRMAPGAAFPAHKHLGEERVLVLQGRLQDNLGMEYGPGEVVCMREGTSHSFFVVSEDELVYLIVAGGVEIAGVVFKEPPQELLH